MGQSYYPWWHGSILDLRECLTRMALEYWKPMILVEAAYSASFLFPAERFHFPRCEKMIAQSCTNPRGRADLPGCFRERKSGGHDEASSTPCAVLASTGGFQNPIQTKPKNV